MNKKLILITLAVGVFVFIQRVIWPRYATYQASKGKPIIGGVLNI